MITRFKVPHSLSLHEICEDNLRRLGVRQKQARRGEGDQDGREGRAKEEEEGRRDSVNAPPLHSVVPEEKERRQRSPVIAAD